MTDSGILINYYEILEVAPSADDEAIVAAAKKMRRVWAKRQGLADQERRHEAELRMRHIAEAERMLLDEARRGQYDQQLATYKPPISSGPTLDLTNTAEGWLERTEAFLHIGDSHSANYAAREATTLTPQNDAAWALRAQTSLLLGNERDAVFELNEALRIRPDESAHHFDLGTIYESAGEWGNALTSFRAASQLDPSEPMFWVAQASVHLQNENTTEALSIMEQIVVQHPNNKIFNTYLALALHDASHDRWTLLTNGRWIITREEQIQPSRRDLTRALSLDFDDAELRESLNESLEMVTRAEQMKFRLPGRKAVEFGSELGFRGMIAGFVFGYGMWFIVPLIFFASNPLSGVVVTLLVCVLLYAIAYKPMWFWNNKDTKTIQVR